MGVDLNAKGASFPANLGVVAGKQGEQLLIDALGEFWVEEAGQTVDGDARNLTVTSEILEVFEEHVCGEKNHALSFIASE